MLCNEKGSQSFTVGVKAGISSFIHLNYPGCVKASLLL